MPVKVQPGFKSPRAHDIHQGLQAAQIDRSSGLVGEELEATQLVGMAAALATGIKGIDYVADAIELKKIASQQYDIPTLEFPLVVELLEPRASSDREERVQQEPVEDQEHHEAEIAEHQCGYR